MEDVSEAIKAETIVCMENLEAIKAETIVFMENLEAFEYDFEAFEEAYKKRLMLIEEEHSKHSQ